MALFRRTESPPSFSDYRKYKPFLRRDFQARCAYCERTEGYLGGGEAFEVEHFRPRSRFPGLATVYRNLYYACRKCNAHKSETWPSDDQVADGLRFADPCAEDLYLTHARERPTGAVEPLTRCGIYTVRHIRLDRDEIRRWRRLRDQAREDVPRLTAVLRMLETLVSAPETGPQEREQILDRLHAIKRHIEDSQSRFSI